VVLLPLLASMFPFYMSDTYVLQCYVDNLLQITTYFPKSRGPVLRIIFVELTKIDVSCDARFFNYLVETCMHDGLIRANGQRIVTNVHFAGIGADNLALVIDKHIAGLTVC